MLLFFCLLVVTEGFLFSNPRLIRKWSIRATEDRPDFDPKEFEEALKRAGPVWGGGPGASISDPDKSEILSKIRDEQIAQAEQIFRKYPFEETQLPVLPDCNNYYSGSFGDFFWHQNADQVYVYMPIEESVSKKDIDVKFAAKSVEVFVNGERFAFFECLERIIPDGSFWLVEASEKNGKRYIQLDLEKRFRMINWKSLFGVPEGKVAMDIEAEANRSKMLEKLFAANKGMSKIMTNGPLDPESMEKMMQNEDLVKMISDQVYGPRGDNGEDYSGAFENGEGVVLDGTEESPGWSNGGDEIIDAEMVTEEEDE